MAKEYAKKFYHSTAWQRCRAAYIAQRQAIDGGMCEKCGERVGEELHHKIMLTTENINDTSITINQENLIFLCKNCHFKEHEDIAFKSFKKKNKILNNGVWFDENGQPHKQKVYIVYGAPASGKTRYVQEHKLPNDLVIDLDLIKQSLTMSTYQDDADNLFNITIEIRDLIYQLIEDGKADCKCIWIIATLANKKKRMELQKKFNAEFIFIQATKEKCLKQAKDDEKRKEKTFQYYLIKKWFEDFEP